MTDIIQANAVLRRAIFGRLNTYQYSLIFLMKRLFRLNDLALTEEILRLLASNPYRDDASKPYESRWSLVFLIDKFSFRINGLSKMECSIITKTIQKYSQNIVPLLCLYSN